MNRRLRNKLKYEGSVIPHDKYGDIVVVEYQTTLESLVNSVETYVSLLHYNVVQVVKSLRSEV